MSDDIPQGKWYPDRGERVFVPSFECMGTVLEICPLIRPRQVAAEVIYYFVELDDGRYFNGTLGRWIEAENTRTLLTAEQLIPSKWAGEIKTVRPIDG